MLVRLRVEATNVVEKLRWKKLAKCCPRRRFVFFVGRRIRVGDLVELELLDMLQTLQRLVGMLNLLKPGEIQKHRGVWGATAFRVLP